LPILYCEAPKIFTIFWDTLSKLGVTVEVRSFDGIFFYYTRGLQRDVFYLGCPIAPSYMSPNAGGGVGGGSCGVSAKELVEILTRAPKKNGDINEYLK
jgi:hypothetical protein